MAGWVSLRTPCGSSGIWTGVTRLFSLLGVVESAVDTASTFEGGLEAFCGESFGLFGVLSPPLCLDEYAGDLRCGILLLDRRPRGPGGGGVPRVANVRMRGRGTRSDHLAAGSMLRLFCSCMFSIEHCQNEILFWLGMSRGGMCEMLHEVYGVGGVFTNF
jgi:hypothetical protein